MTVGELVEWLGMYGPDMLVRVLDADGTMLITPSISTVKADSHSVSGTNSESGRDTYYTLGEDRYYGDTEMVIIE